MCTYTIGDLSRLEDEINAEWIKVQNIYMKERKDLLKIFNSNKNDKIIGQVDLVVMSWNEPDISLISYSMPTVSATVSIKMCCIKMKNGIANLRKKKKNNPLWKREETNQY